MRHNRVHHRLGRTSSQSQAVLRNLVTSLFDKERISTTERRAKEARRLAESMITFAKRGDLHSRRQAARVIRDKAVLKKLFEEIAPRFASRQGGYTRILHSGLRRGDVARMSLLELVSEEDAKKRGKKRHARKKEHAAAGAKAKTAGEAAAEVEEAAGEEPEGEKKAAKKTAKKTTKKAAKPRRLGRKKKAEEEAPEAEASAGAPPGGPEVEAEEAEAAEADEGGKKKAPGKKTGGEKKSRTRKKKE
jgi:large subunit ribosomal protein L17